MRQGIMRRLMLAACAIPSLVMADDPAPAAIPAMMIHISWTALPASDFARESRLLPPAIQALCDATDQQSALAQARQQWLVTLISWERLSAVAIGPLLDRRSQRQIDFTPTRPRLIEKAVKVAPANAADMELIGTPAKGLPALEWLLWVKPVLPASAECRYAFQVAEDIRREAEVLAAAPAVISVSLGDLLNQWLGGLERLRWANLEMPARVAMTGSREVPDFPRRASGASAASWAAQWSGLRELANGPLATALRQRGNDSGLFRQMVARVDTTLTGLNPDDMPSLLAAARDLAALKREVENDVAPALGVSIGFSDADGD